MFGYGIGGGKAIKWCGVLEVIFRSGVKGLQTKSGSRLWGLQTNLDLSQFTKGQLTTPSSVEKVYFKFLLLFLYQATHTGGGGAVRPEMRDPACVCDTACASHHHGNARSPANYLLELAHRDTVNDT